MTWRTGPQPDGRRAESLTGPARQVYQAVLAAFARTGQPPARSELDRLARNLGASPDAVLAELAGADAVAVRPSGDIRAAYPFSPARTRIRVSWAGGPLPTRCARSTRSACPPCSAARSPLPRPEPDTSRIITVAADGSRARWRPRTAVVFAGSAGDACRPAADRSCGYINFFASRRAARAWARRHSEVTGRLLTRDGALGIGIGIAEFGSLLRAVPSPGAPE
jgi:hypothetical protein